MQHLPKRILLRLQKRRELDLERTLTDFEDLTDFCSNDYLGFARNSRIYESANQLVVENKPLLNGSGGARLLSGNHILYKCLEDKICSFHRAEASLIFNSGYDANLGFFSSVPGRRDLVLYDELIHASIRDGMKLGDAKILKFKHNNVRDLEEKLDRAFSKYDKPDEVYVVTESVFSMDGDMAPLEELCNLCYQKGLRLVVDEAHATGVFGARGQGLCQKLDIQKQVFCRLVTFGKALGAHGAAILCPAAVKKYLLNFARSFIYTTALSPHSLATILSAYQLLDNNEPEGGIEALKNLRQNMNWFTGKLAAYGLSSVFMPSLSPIRPFILGNNKKVLQASRLLREKGFHVASVLSPTVPKGSERLRICLHSFNTKNEIEKLLETLRNVLKEKV